LGHAPGCASSGPGAVAVMAKQQRPTADDRAKAIRVALSGIADDLELGELAQLLATLHPKNNTLPRRRPARAGRRRHRGKRCDPGSSRSSPKASANATFPEDWAHTKAQHHKAEYALRAAAMVQAGVDPGLLNEVIWWRTDDLWFWALEALVIYVRAGAERRVETVSAVCGRIASRHDVPLAAAT
jgi:hypothetical protein